MKVNSSFIEMGKYQNTINKAQCRILAQLYPADEGWEKLVVGQELSVKDSNLFLLLRGEFTDEVQAKIIKNYQLLAEFHKKDKKEEQNDKNDKKPKKQKDKKNLGSELEIYCDGACRINPGKAGSGLAIYEEGKKKPTLLYGEYEGEGTNNTAELNALYKALLLTSEAPRGGIIYSDSQYSIDCISKWAYKWKEKGWKKKGGEIKNLEIIKVAHELYEKNKAKIEIKHVKAHAGVEGNELADRMANLAIDSKNKEYATFEYLDVNEVLKMRDG